MKSYFHLVVRHAQLTLATRTWKSVFSLVVPVLDRKIFHRYSRYPTGKHEIKYGIHPQTVRHRLRQNVHPIHAYRPCFGQILTRRHRTARRDCCRRHLHFRRTDWDLILCSDECRFNLSHVDGRGRVYRRKRERFADACVIERDCFGGGSLLVWCGIMGGNKTHLTGRPAEASDPIFNTVKSRYTWRV